MIFAVGDHIEQIIKGTKTQTRRVAKENSLIYQVGQTYAIQPGRGKPGDPRGRILITRRWLELRQDRITSHDAEAEGGYTPEDYEELFNKMHRGWASRRCYEFEFWAKEDFESLWAALSEAHKHPSIPWSTIKSQQLRMEEKQ